MKITSHKYCIHSRYFVDSYELRHSRDEEGWRYVSTLIFIQNSRKIQMIYIQIRCNMITKTLLQLQEYNTNGIGQHELTRCFIIFHEAQADAFS